MIDKQIAVTLTNGTTLYSDLQTNSDGSPLRCRVTGKCKTWKTRPDDFRLPVKHGLYDSFYIINDGFAEHWHLDEDEAKKRLGQYCVKSSTAFDLTSGRFYRLNTIHHAE
jgi:hypothetical protein